MSAFELITRVVISYIFLLLLARLMGRKEVSQMTFFNFISAIVFGTLGGTMITDPSMSIRNGLLVVACWGAITIAAGYLDLKSKTARNLMTGEPVIIIRDGLIMEKTLKRVRLDINSLMAQLREKEIFSLSDVDYAIFETDGKLSVMKKENGQQPPPPGPAIFPLPTEVISDGNINTANLDKLQLDEAWLRQQLQQQSITSIRDVFYAEVQKDGKLYVDKRDDR
ncbi:Uncharacterized membrane protein YcaP, DUF421 family [Fictibacillus solisalsi]|uniref:Uncharacterized membrane protein YcaP, DUF421 family n=1 Tax=Fictibacillus solisalsi TaxID=459525 RepID=A0A1G9YSB9_9BACL|nr:DUF421 domain-containing protein [Fictibacillus solisalsi]SDN11401.1 Uncharacterized membrane protein YcaP, DUF421 family [Fictibacillus solisalsi]